MAATQALDFEDDIFEAMGGGGQIGVLRAVDGTETHVLEAGVNVIGREGAGVDSSAWQERFSDYAVNEIYIDHPSISAMHAALFLEGAGGLLCFVKDLGSTNKTRIHSSGSSLILQSNDRYRVDPGDKVTLGAVEFEVDFAQSGNFQETQSEDGCAMEEDGQAGGSNGGGRRSTDLDAGRDKVKAPSTPYREDPLCVREMSTPRSPFAEPSLLAIPESGSPFGGFGSFQNLSAMDSVSSPEFKRFKGARQASLQDWCSPKPGERQSKSLDLVRPVLSQDIDLTPPGSPKLTKNGTPLFPPRLHKKSGRSSSLSKIARRVVARRELDVGRDVLSELLACDESLGWNRT